MKVILSADSIKFPLTGIGRYTYELAKGLQNVEIDDFLMMRGLRLHKQLPSQNLVASQTNSNSTSLISRASRNLKKTIKENSLVGSLYSYFEPLGKGLVLNSYKEYIYHGTNFYLPNFKGVNIATIHDLSIYKYPETHPTSRVKYMRSRLKQTIRKADFLITDTEHTRQEVAEYFSWPLEKIRAVHLASSPEFFPKSYDEVALPLMQFNLSPGNYVLYTGTVEPRKNLKVLFQAYSKIPKEIKLKCPLVISGYTGWNSDELHSLMQVGQEEGWLKYLGFVDSELLPMLMAGARLFAYPSLYEGFGLPILEAMASGVPVICSNASTLPEVAGKAAVFHHPDDADSLHNLLVQGIEDEGWRSNFIKLGLERSKEFSWSKCTEETLSVYKEAIS